MHCPRTLHFVDGDQSLRNTARLALLPELERPPYCVICLPRTATESEVYSKIQRAKHEGHWKGYLQEGVDVCGEKLPNEVSVEQVYYNSLEEDKNTQRIGKCTQFVYLETKEVNLIKYRK